MLLDGGLVSDFHSHLVPGVDDGAQTLEEALGAVQRMVDIGIGRILTTPHLRGSLTHDGPELERRLAEVDVAWTAISEAVERRFPGVEFRRGHEVMLDVPNPDLSDARLRLAGTAFVLIEWPGCRSHLGPSLSFGACARRDTDRSSRTRNATTAWSMRLSWPASGAPPGRASR